MPASTGGGSFSGGFAEGVRGGVPAGDLDGSGDAVADGDGEGEGDGGGRFVEEDCGRARCSVAFSPVIGSARGRSYTVPTTTV
ncbi:hypothetical protein [Streptomyces niveus]|uniref:hypothetical protein n=1 Tax=Streptomyces niveus TaxID=193462 RepID=UPI00342830E0